MSNKLMMCDPPSGWRWGFPKPMPKLFDTQQEFYAWLVAEGYPQKMITEMGSQFYCRYWEQDDEIQND